MTLNDTPLQCYSVLTLLDRFAQLVSAMFEFVVEPFSGPPCFWSQKAPMGKVSRHCGHTGGEFHFGSSKQTHTYHV